MPWTPHDMPFIVEKAHARYVELAEEFQATIDARDDALDDAVVAVRGIGGSRLGVKAESLGSRFLSSPTPRERRAWKWTIGRVCRCGARETRDDPADWCLNLSHIMCQRPGSA